MKPEPSIFDEPDAAADEQAMREGEADADAGRVTPHEDVAAWLKTWGTTSEAALPKPWPK
jgi:predicted transcriptional regulator